MSERSNTALNLRLIAVKGVLWFLLGAAAMVAALRYARGLGATTALTDLTPWGMWIGFDVLAGVALAGGGFVLAATVHIFGRETYRPVLRPAILTAFLGYVAVVIGLLVDLGRPWNIWRPIFHQNLHSPLFEVAMCVMLYTTVLALEFAPVGLKAFAWAAPVVRTLKRATLPLVIIGIGLSSLHQSSLGTLFLLTEGRMHPLWYSPALPLMFLISAIGLGLAMVIFESRVSAWLYRREAEWPLLEGLSRAAAVVIGLYLAVRLGDLAVRGQLGYAFAGSAPAVLFWVEIGLSALAPILLFTLPRTRGRPWAIGWGAGLAVAGFILHRADVGGISHVGVTGELYVPALGEVLVSAGVVSAMALVFLFFVERLEVWHDRPAAGPLATPLQHPGSGLWIGERWLGGGRRAAVAGILGLLFGLAVVESQTVERSRPASRPARPARTVAALAAQPGAGIGRALRLLPGEDALPAAALAMPAGAPLPEGGLLALLMDGGTAGEVLFDHRDHQRRLGGEGSCGACHHLNVPQDRGTSCARCHRDLHGPTDTFAHDQHVQAHGGKRSCAVCHLDRAHARTRAESKPCAECHRPTPGTLVAPAAGGVPGIAPAYREAMHGLCIPCHRQAEERAGMSEPRLSRCAGCHLGAPAEPAATGPGVGLARLAP